VNELLISINYRVLMFSYYAYHTDGAEPRSPISEKESITPILLIKTVEKKGLKSRAVGGHVSIPSPGHKVVFGILPLLLCVMR